MTLIIISIVAGIIATGGMTLFLWLIDRTGVTSANMVRAVGSAVTRSYESSLLPGSIIHFSSGIIFAILYISVLRTLDFQSLMNQTVAGGIIGFAHGFAFSFVMVILAEHHPVEKFQNAGFQVAIVHFFAHIIYGVLVGLVAGWSGNLG
jgi:hypothetical protein